MNSGQQLSRILFLPDKLKIITRWLSQYVTLLLCHMAPDAETQHNLIKWHPNWRSGTLERAGFPFERTSTNQRSNLGNLMRFNKAKWTCALGSECPLCQPRLRAEQTAPELEFEAHTTTAHNLERLQGRAAEAIREPQHLSYKEMQRPLPCSRLEARSPRQDVATAFHYLNPLEKTHIDISQGWTAKEQKATVTSCNKGNTNWEKILKGKKIISVGLEHHWNRGPKGLFSHHPWRFSKHLKSWKNLIWFWSYSCFEQKLGIPNSGYAFQPSFLWMYLTKYSSVRY